MSRHSTLSGAVVFSARIFLSTAQPEHRDSTVVLLTVQQQVTELHLARFCAVINFSVHHQPATHAAAHIEVEGRLNPRPAPRNASPSAAAFESFSTTTGAPVRERSQSPNSKSAQPSTWCEQQIFPRPPIHRPAQSRRRWRRACALSRPAKRRFDLTADADAAFGWIHIGNAAAEECPPRCRRQRFAICCRRFRWRGNS